MHAAGAGGGVEAADGVLVHAGEIATAGGATWSASGPAIERRDRGRARSAAVAGRGARFSDSAAGALPQLSAAICDHVCGGDRGGHFRARDAAVRRFAGVAAGTRTATGGCVCFAAL